MVGCVLGIICFTPRLMADCHSERYRDLLQASTSILSMSSRSQRVVSALDGLRDASIASNTTSVQPIPHPPRKGGKDGMKQASNEYDSCNDFHSSQMDNWTFYNLFLHTLSC